MVKILLVLAVPGIILLSSLFGGGDSSNSVPASAPVQVQSLAPRTKSIDEKTTVQPEQKAEVTRSVDPATAEAAKPAPKATSIVGCGADYYRNVDGNCVYRPSDNPSGASAKCRDGSYSYSLNRRGTCSGHGGVAIWY